ncbi:MAG: hypothetical protein LC123_06935 [Burkholderiales bacterium]|nr:hypothetical protein [Anaerolineae bacterium]MCZ2419556.1 hypothetical protein [Burkholderiales bacterium]
MRQTHFTHQLVEFIPEHLEEGILYVSRRYKTAVHKCACGCGVEVVTPLSPTDWGIQIENSKVTIEPSIGNWSFPCRSHYFVRRGRVVWAEQISRRDVERSRAQDMKARERYIKETNRQKVLSSHNLLYEVWLSLKRWWMSL